jgi:hypothetical protein
MSLKNGLSAQPPSGRSVVVAAIAATKVVMMLLSSPSLTLLAVAIAITAVAAVPDDCPAYYSYASETHGPYTGGAHNLSYMRPLPECRTASFPEVERTISEMKTLVKDPDLFRLFENAFPNTLDTTIAWKGTSADNPDEEVCVAIPSHPISSHPISSHLISSRLISSRLISSHNHPPLNSST